MNSYAHREIDAKWQKRWQDEAAFLTSRDRSKPKYYVLDMFPYPSGAGLHVGHPKGYVATDVVARAKRMMGFNVLRVMGWDAFGLPAERQAVREHRHPREITECNIRTFKLQLQKLGLSYDWSREFATTDPTYYRWTQWIFLKLYEKGLAYQIEAPVNWCPALGTVLANEEVRDGVYVETGDPVERRMMKQWMLRITAYADRLLDGLDELDWPEGIKQEQREWIGRSEGTDVQFAVEGREDVIEVFTTRPDTIFGATYLVLAPEHDLLLEATASGHRDNVRRYRERALARSERERQAGEKTGVFTGTFAVNPVNGERLPIWTADYVLSSYGTGAVFACPAHDERDHAFARAFELPMREVVRGGDIRQAAYTGDGPHVRSGFLNGLYNVEARERVIEWLERQGTGRRVVRYKLRDWLFSRQRYWGEPFPIIERADGTLSAIPEGALPLELPELAAYQPTEEGEPPLAQAKDWVELTDPDTGEPLRRQTHTMPQWAGSCWYYLRFVSPSYDQGPWDSAEERYWMPVDLYVGGAEHAKLHLLYARFWHHFFYDLGLAATREPFRRLVNQGMIHHTSYRDGRGKYYRHEEVEERDGIYYATGTDTELLARREKMSKSRYNVVTPDAVCNQFGADALRLFELFMGPVEEGNDWDTAGVAGTRRFLDRVWRLVEDRDGRLTDGSVEPVDDDALERALHSAIKRVTDSIETLRFNTAISEMMVFVNAATTAKRIDRAWLESFVSILSPFAPHVAEELWERLGHEASLVFASWPHYDEKKLEPERVEIVVQIDGRTRGTVEVPPEADEDLVLRAVGNEKSLLRHLGRGPVNRVVYVPGKLINVVLEKSPSAG